MTNHNANTFREISFTLPDIEVLSAYLDVACPFDFPFVERILHAFITKAGKYVGHLNFTNWG